MRKPARQRRVLKSLVLILAAAGVGILFLGAPAFAISPPFPSPLYLHQEVSTKAAASWQLMSSAPDQAENTSTSIAVAKSTSEFQFVPGVSGSTATGPTTGNGWFFDAPLGGKYSSGSTWTFSVRLHTSKGSFSNGTIKAYVYRYNGSAYSAPLLTATRTGTSPTGTATTFSFTATPGTDIDMQGGWLYVAFTWTGAGGTGNSAMEFSAEGSGLTVADQPKAATGASTIPALGWYLALAGILVFSFFAVSRGVLKVKRNEA
jgi:hypothetical protein